MSKVTAYYHIVFCTKSRAMTIPLEHCDDLYRYIWKTITNLKCELLRIGGIQNHVHMLVNLHPTIALSYFMQGVKGGSSSWMKGDGRYPEFNGWAADYYACTISPQNRNAVIDYIKFQKSHHLCKDFDNEVSGLYRYADLDLDDRDLR